MAVNRAAGGFLQRLVVATAALALGLGLSGCAGESDRGTPGVSDIPVEELYNEALERAGAEDWRNAAVAFERVEQEYPYSVWARRAILMSAYAYYQINRYPEAIAAADRFIALHAGNKDAPYAYYLKAISHYEQIVDVGRDQATTQQALVALNDLVVRFPDTIYARDARIKMDLTLDHLAGKEMAIGRYYLRREQYVAAINRFNTVVNTFQTTSQVPEALGRLTEAYLALGLRKEAQAAAATLGYNYPGSVWYEDSYALLTGEARPSSSGDGWFFGLF